MKKKVVLIVVMIFLASTLFANNMLSSAIQYQATIFDDIYNLMQRQLNLSFRSLKDNIVPALLLALITLEIMWLATQAILQKTMPLSEVLVKGFLICLVVIITQNLDFFAKGLMQIFTKTAYVAGDSGNLYSDTIEVGQYALFRPSIIITSCQSMIEPLKS